MRKRLLSMFCVLAFSLFSLPGTALAKENTSIPKHLTISTADELMDFADKVNNGPYRGDGTADMLVELTADIDMTGYNWTPIDVYDDPYFMGTFDGNDHTISGLTIDNVDVAGNFGLFGSTACTIRDVHVSGEFIDKANGRSDYWFGSIAGYTNGDIIGCTADFTVSSDDGVLRGRTMGGIVGEILGVTERVTLENCVSNTAITGKLSGETYVKGSYVGGIAGNAGNVEIINCRNIGDITITDTGDFGYIGGIVGQTWAYEDEWADADNSPGVVLDHCVNNGDIVNSASASIVSIGGIGGRIVYSSAVICCTNNGTVSATNNIQGGANAGGIIGSVYYGRTNDVDALVESCLNNGTISGDGNTNIAGLVCQCGSDGTVIIRAGISLGTLTAAQDSDNVHPVLAESSNSTTLEINSNYYDSSLTTKGNIAQTVIEGSTGKPITELETEAFIQQVNSEGGYFRLDENKHIEVIPLQYQLTVVDSYAANSGEGLHEENEVVTIDAGNRPGYRFAGWTATSGTITDSSASRTTFIMPDEATTVTASWQYVPPTTYPPTVEQPEEGGTVEINASSPSKGQWVTITPNPDLGFEVDEVTVTDSSGNKVDVINNEDGTYKFCQPGSRVTISVTFVRKSLPFADVEEGAWYYDAVHYVYFHEIITGTSATTFEPNTTLSRAMVAQILYNLEGQPTVTDESTFTDVNGHWAADPIAWAQQTGVVNGYENNTFRPNQAVTREELAQMLYNYAQYKEIILPAVGDLSKFSDGDKVSSWAQTAMKWATGLQVINGYEDNTLRPSGNTTRAEAASMILGMATTLMK